MLSSAVRGGDPKARSESTAYESLAGERPAARAAMGDGCAAKADQAASSSSSRFNSFLISFSAL